MAVSSSKTWSRLGFCLAGAAVVTLAFWATGNPVQAQKKVYKTVPKVVEPATPSAKATVPTVRGPKLSAESLAKQIDQMVDARLKAEAVVPSVASTDSEFLRRVYLDLIGVVPTAEQTKAFLDDKNPQKRAALIDSLLANERFGTYHAEQWAGMLLPRESNNRRLDHAPLRTWLADGFNSNKPIDKLVYELVTATGEQDENGAVTYFIGNPTVDKITDSVTRMFLGVQLQCAQCHNHPFVDWKQDEYWAMAAFFMNVRLSANPQQAAKKGISPAITEVAAKAKARKKALPESAKFVPAKFLQGEQPELNAKEPYRPVLAEWLTARDNPFFARAMVNRWWHTMFGRGLVNPVDDMHDDNGASHPELLETLTTQFKASGFDLHYLVKAICLSDAYQRSGRPSGGNDTDTTLYSHRQVRTLSPEQLIDSLTTVLQVPLAGKKDRVKVAVVGKKGGAGPRENFLAFFRIDEGANSLEYQAGIPQALRFMNAGPLNNMNALVTQAMNGASGKEQVIDNLFLAIYARQPTAEEARRMLAFVEEQSTPRLAYTDVAWALINSSEFALNH